MNYRTMYMKRSCVLCEVGTELDVFFRVKLRFCGLGGIGCYVSRYAARLTKMIGL
jgi:hypothetical protein